MSILDPDVLRTSPRSARLVVAAFALVAFSAATLQVQARLRPTEAAVDVLAIESVEHPTEN